MSDDIYKETFDTWDKMSELYQQKFMHMDIYNQTYDVFLHLLKSAQSTLLELGCGPGNITQYLLKQKPELKIFGTDISPNMIELARRNNPQAEFEVMDCRDIEKVNKRFDGIVIGFCLPYLSDSDAKKLIQNCHSLLKENGALYISFVAGPSSKSGWKTNSYGDRVYFHYHEKETLQTLLNEYEFEAALEMEVPFHQQGEVHNIFITKKIEIAI